MYGLMDADRRKFVGITTMPHHYVESGLDNIFLDNGYTIYKTANGEGAFIEDIENLHKVIGRWLVSLRKPLTGAELRFLRLEMEQTQRELATILGSLEPTLRLWERHRTKPMPGPPDRLVRALYLEFIGEDGRVRNGK